MIDAVSKENNPIVQECVGDDDTEFTAGVIVFAGKAMASIIMRRDLRDGNTFRAYAQPYSDLNRYLESVAEKLAVNGPVNFQFRLVNGLAKIFEINCRFSGTTFFRALANFNEVEMCWNYLLKGEKIVQPEISPVTVLRYFEEIAVPGPAVA